MGSEPNASTITLSMVACSSGVALRTFDVVVIAMLPNLVAPARAGGNSAVGAAPNRSARPLGLRARAYSHAI
jgi:hypothetical protein